MKHDDQKSETPERAVGVRAGGYVAAWRLYEREADTASRKGDHRAAIQWLVWAKEALRAEGT